MRHIANRHHETARRRWNAIESAAAWYEREARSLMGCDKTLADEAADRFGAPRVDVYDALGFVNVRLPA